MMKNMLAGGDLTLADFMELCQQCADVQREVLLDIISRNADTALGRKYHFGKLKTVDDFRKHVPVMNWRDLEPYASRAERGAADQMFSGRPELFIITSGTTGREKMIPESRAGLAAKNTTTNLRMAALRRHFPDFMQGKMLPLVNGAEIGETEGGIPYGTASGITLMNASEKWRRIVAYPSDILKITDAAALDYVMMRFAIAEDVRLIIGNNAGRMEPLAAMVAENAEMMIEDIRHGTISKKVDISPQIRTELDEFLVPDPEKAGQLKRFALTKGGLTPESYWPRLAVVSCWLAGSVGHYVDRIRPLFAEKVQFMDFGYGATEGKFNVPLKPGEPAGPLAIHAGFYEFGFPGDAENLLLAHELKDGELYELYYTNYSGLYRYAMHDVVRVDGFVGTTPRIRFEAKMGDVANICGEKMSPRVLEAAVAEAAEAEGVMVKHWCLVADLVESRYNFCLELDAPSASISDVVIARLASLIEANLYGDGTLPYPVFRKQQLIKPATVTLMSAGWSTAWRDARKKPGDAGNQLKLPLVCANIPLSEYCLCRSGAGA